MPFYFTCPYCFKKTLVEDKYSGQTGPCACCGKTVTLPEILTPAATTPALSTSELFLLGRPSITDSAASPTTNQVPIANTKVVSVKPITLNSREIAKRRIMVSSGVALCLLLVGYFGWQSVRYFTSSNLFVQWQLQHDRTVSMNNVARIATALNAYAARHNSYPPAVVYDANGKPMHSWRVLILSELGEPALFNQYRFTEPWDSEHNVKLMTQCPAVFISPFVIRGKSTSESSYSVVVGNSTLFPDPQSSNANSIPDGSNRTLLVVEAANPIHEWTKPIDVQANGTGPIKLGGLDPGGFAAALADGQPVWIPAGTAAGVIDAMLTPNGGEAIDTSRFQP
jgi:Protein of unknown function (DUF1559)